MRSRLLVATLVAVPAASTAGILQPSQLAPRVAPARLDEVAEQIHRADDDVARATLSLRERVAAARRAAELRATIASDVRFVQPYGVIPSAESRERWRRVTGTPIDPRDARETYARCVELVRTAHVMSDDARWCRSANGRPAAATVWWLPTGTARAANDRDGLESVRDYDDAAAALARAPADLGARVRLAALQAQADDPERALETLRAVPASHRDARLVRAVAAALAADLPSARTALEELARDGTDLRAAYNLAQVLRLTPPVASHVPHPERHDALRALAALRVFLCGASTAPDVPDGAYRAAIRTAHELQAQTEYPLDSSGDCAYSRVLPREDTPAPVRDHCDGSRTTAAMSCARAQTWLVELLSSPPDLPLALPPASSPRPLAPAVAAWSGPRPIFSWVYPRAVTWELCADRACTSVLRTATARDTLRPERDLPEGLSYWRVREGASASPVRALRVSQGQRSTMAFPDVDGDGQPDVALGRTGYYARFSLNTVPTLVFLHRCEGLYARAVYAGDLDGDSYGDFLQSTHFGLRVLRGSPDGLRCPVFFDDGSAMGTPKLVGDVDGDGLDDLLLRMSGSDSLRSRTGATVRGPVLVAPRAQPFGDVDGDGLDELAFARFDSLTGRGGVDLYRGSRAGLAPTPLRTWGLTRAIERLDDFGDIDGDGRADPALWSPARDEFDPPGTYTLYPSRGPVQHTALRVYGRFGAVFPAGDLDRDGYGDLLVADPTRITLHFGARSGLSTRTLAVGPRDARAEVFAQPEPGASPPVLWVFVTEPLRALRVTARAATEVALVSR